MTRRIRNLVPAFTFATGALLTQTALASAPQDTVHLSGIPYGADGAYFHSGDFYNDMPVYTLDHIGYTWSLYQRSNGRWYVDFDEPGEDWSGTVAIGPNADFPWQGDWDHSTDAASPVDSIVIGGAAYSSYTTGVYTWDGTVYNGKPVFQRQGGGVTWSVYQRSNGRWYLDFNDVSEDWDGTVEIGPDAISPTQGEWDDANVLVVDSLTRPLPLRGRYDFGTFAGGTDCRDIDFAAPFDGDDVNIQVSLDHANGPGSHDAMTVWVEGVDRHGARICARETSNFDGSHDANVSISYLAYRPGATLDGDRGRFEDSDGFTGTGNHCNTIAFDQSFAVKPIVQATVTHPDTFTGNNEAITVWLEEVTTSAFKVCVRETANMSAGHPAYSIDWIAHEPGSWPFYGADEGRVESVPAFSGTTCRAYGFTTAFTDVPQVFVTADHRDAGGNHDATTVWLEDVRVDGFTACVRELANPGNPGSNSAGSHDNSLKLAWTAVGNR